MTNVLQNTLSSWNKNRLRNILILFFLALTIPTAILINQAYSQLKWEAFHHYRLQAEELSKRIDLRYKELIKAESARPFTDYSFLNVSGNTSSGFLQRSPLSSYPIKSKFPGLIGYFQIDNKGQFSTPLLPSDENNYGLSKIERRQRSISQSKIYTILSQNKLVDTQTTKTEEESLLQESIAPKPAADTIANNATLQSIAPEKPATLSSETAKPQAAFDQLQKQSPYKSKINQDRYFKNRRRIEDLKLKKTYQEKSRSLKAKKAPRVESKSRQVIRRKESSVLPAYPALQPENKMAKPGNSLSINMFESEIDEFEFSLLESGHFVLYRKVWRNGLRYIQGLLINPEVFINDVIAKSFYETSVSSASNLSIAYQGNILSGLNSNNLRNSYSSRNNNTLQGNLLLQSRLSAPLDKIELLFSISRLPAGPGATVITWLSIILLVILCGGFYILYILGLKQITLARQQQDFVSAVSHELKTPLTSIRMYGEILREGWTTDEKRQQYYDYIYDESERLSRLINNILQLARMTRNELQVDLTAHTIAELFDTIQSKIGSHVERAQFKLSLQCEDNIKSKSILVDLDYFSQIFINLVDNAIKFSNNAEQKQIDINCKVIKDNKVQFSIRDYGPGISKDQIKKIFQLFYRSENELTRETVGTGIGLSLVKQLSTAMQAKIDVVNTKPGTEFHIIFNCL
ncbi:MAG TPA: HAMP domain-containing histidine kinase [Gammaproteobacteria bacterium]|nr:HAMP domain-containing histidine kinase [Gammaproteobacteria bacterium]